MKIQKNDGFDVVVELEPDDRFSLFAGGSARGWGYDTDNTVIEFNCQDLLALADRIRNHEIG